MKFLRRIQETKKTVYLLRRFLIIFDFSTILYQSIPSNRYDDDNDVMLKILASLY